MADSAENVILQGYAVTGATAGEQAVITQGYGGTGVIAPILGRLVVNRTGGTATGIGRTGGTVES